MCDTKIYAKLKDSQPQKIKNNIRIFYFYRGCQQVKKYIFLLVECIILFSAWEKQNNTREISAEISILPLTKRGVKVVRYSRVI